MDIKEMLRTIATGILDLPGNVLVGISTIVFGAPPKKSEQERQTSLLSPFPGVLGFLARIGQGITQFLETYKREISIAFWIGLAVGGGFALTVAFWPAALTLFVGLSIYGVSIASLFTGFAAQVAAVGGAFAIVTFAASLVSALIVDLCIGIKNKFTGSTSKVEDLQVELNGESDGNEDGDGLGQDKALHFDSPLKPHTSPSPKGKSEANLEDEVEHKGIMGLSSGS